MTSSQPTTGASAAAPAAGLPSAASSSSSQRPTSHTQRYDRQLRLWASSGQASLERSSILLLGCTATGCAALKNVILPGVGRVCIVDPRPVSEVDLGVNFFLAGEDEEAKQDHRADRALKLLLELNPSVKGEARHNVRSRPILYALKPGSQSSAAYRTSSRSSRIQPTSHS